MEASRSLFYTHFRRVLRLTFWFKKLSNEWVFWKISTLISADFVKIKWTHYSPSIFRCSHFVHDTHTHAQRWKKKRRLFLKDISLNIHIKKGVLDFTYSKRCLILHDEWKRAETVFTHFFVSSFFSFKKLSRRVSYFFLISTLISFIIKRTQ